jgi:phosphoenolpyruvate carboxykinase (ATP)
LLIRSRVPNYDDDSKTENTRAAYPVENIANAVIPGVGGHPKNVVFLTADAFGVLPPVSKLTPQQAMYHFMSGYTAKVAGTEAGVTEPQATFSTCFGAPFMPLPPKVYAEMLRVRLLRHDAQCWLVNTGWQGGPYGVGKRMSLTYTRAMVDALIDGKLAEVEFEIEPSFGLNIPKSVPGVPSVLLSPHHGTGTGFSHLARSIELLKVLRKAIRQVGSHPVVGGFVLP